MARGSETFGTQARSRPRAVHDARFFGEVAYGGSVGAGEAYMLGYWSADDLTAAMRILLQNRAVLDGMERGLASLSAPLRKAMHWAARNSRDGSRRNIAAHYDLSNEFFALFLDPTMMYSSAFFEQPAMSLEQASLAKLDRICRRLALQPGDHVLEIGTGWGGFALHAARHYGCRVTTTTISERTVPPGARTRRRRRTAGPHPAAARGLPRPVRPLRQAGVDRDDRGGRPRVPARPSSPNAARCCATTALMLLQAITIADQRYDSARRSVDFIRKHIFPGSCIPSISALTGAAARASDLKLFHLEDIGPHYATTLKAWRENLLRNVEAVRALGLSGEFIRKWEFYLCYCEAGFAERALGDVQALFVKPGARP